MRSDIVFANELCTLIRSKAMLLIDDDVGEVFELYAFLNEGMGTNEDGDLSIFNPFQKLGARDVGPTFWI